GTAALGLSGGAVEVRVRFPYPVAPGAAGVAVSAGPGAAPGGPPGTRRGGPPGAPPPPPPGLRPPRPRPPPPRRGGPPRARAPPAPDTVAFGLRGPGPAALRLEVRPAPGAPPVRFRLRLLPELLVTPEDGGQTLSLSPGTRFAVAPGGAYAATVAIADEGVVA